MARRLKIVSDGTRPGTKVYVIDEANPDAALEPVKHVTAVSWRFEADKRFATATVEVDAVEVDVVGDEPEDRPDGD